MADDTRTAETCSSRAPWNGGKLTDQTRESVTAWIAHGKLPPDGFLFPRRVHQLPHLKTRHYARLVNRWVAMIGLDPAEE